MTETPELDGLAAELEGAAERLRAGDLDAGAAADLVDECARLASRAAAELERAARAAAWPGQPAVTRPMRENPPR